MLGEDYGIRFPADNNSLSFDDTVFNLEFQYWNPWQPWRTPYIKYWFYRKDGKPMDTKVTLKRGITLQVKTKFYLYGGNPYFEYKDEVEIGIESGESHSEGTIYDDDCAKLVDFKTTPKDYYFQFT